MVVGDLGPRRVVDQLLGVGVEHDPLRGRDGLALVDEPRDEPRAAPGRSQTRPCVRPVSAPIGFVAALKITLRHCGPRASATACRRHAGARAGVGEALDLLERRRARLERPERRVALDVPLHDAGLEDLARPGRSCRGSRARRGAASTSSLPIPFCTDATAPSANACAVAAIAALGVHRLRRDDPEVARRQLAPRRVVARSRPTTSPAPDSRRPFALIASTCSCARSYAHTSTSSSVGEVRREQRADRAAADDADPHAASAVRDAGRAGSENSRPPVRPEGRRISTSAMIAARMTSRVPGGQVELEPDDVHALLGLAQERVEAAHRERADDRAPEARRRRRRRASRASGTSARGRPGRS